MTGLAFIGLALAGGLGAVLRFVVDGLVNTRKHGALPVGTMLVNVSGSFLIGLVVGLATTSMLDQTWATIIAGGLLGGYTTFSTASFETVRLAQEHRPRLALVTGIVPILVGVVAATAGLALGALI